MIFTHCLIHPMPSLRSCSNTKEWSYRLVPFKDKKLCKYIPKLLTSNLPLSIEFTQNIHKVLFPTFAGPHALELRLQFHRNRSFPIRAYSLRINQKLITRRQGLFRRVERQRRIEKIIIVIAGTSTARSGVLLATTLGTFGPGKEGVQQPREGRVR